MPAASQLHRLTPSLAFWYAFDPASKSDLFSTCLADERRHLLLIDPIPLTADADDSLLRLGSPAGIVVTNANHVRSAAQFSDRFKIPIVAHPALAAESSGAFEGIDTLHSLFPELSAIFIEGGAPQEIALHFDREGGTLIVGDCLIHFDPYGLALLPKKYCSDQKKMQRSVKQLLAREAARLLFAHGLPILNRTMSRLDALLNNE